MSRRGCLVGALSCQEAEGGRGRRGPLFSSEYSGEWYSAAMCRVNALAVVVTRFLRTVG